MTDITDFVAAVTEDLAQLQMSSPGADLARQLVADETETNPGELPPNEKLCFFQELTRLTETEFNRVIDHMGGIGAFNGFLFREACNRQEAEPGRIYWQGRVTINPEEALNSPLPSASRVARSSENFVRFPRKFPAVCPAILRCRSFLKFHEVFKTESQAASTRLSEWRDFFQDSNKPYANEKGRYDAVFKHFKAWMEDVPGVAAWHGQSKTFAATDSRIDIAFFAPDLQDWPLVIIEYKSEAHSSTKADPIAQATHYYLQQLNTTPLQGSFNAPTLLLQIVGTYAAAHAVIHSGHDLRGPAFVGTHLLAEIEMGIHHDRGDQQQRKVNAFWLAIKACVHELVHEIALQLVTDLSRSRQTAWETVAAKLAWRPACVYPWIVRAGSFRFKYDCVLGPDKMVFKARLENGKKGDHIVVKFVNHVRYAMEAHELLAREGLAPRIYHSEVINGEWTMLLMEHMEDLKNVVEFERQGHVLLREHFFQEKRALNILHSAGYVHGDLRDANVMVDESGRVCIIDFDWCGESGTARYPILMNMLEITWPAGAEATALIESEHDLWWFEKRYAQLWASEPENQESVEVKKEVEN